ncbi:MAG TPA: hypothetical protein ENJ84_10160 [Gammaproteobacteria bacterium]|nr:hypothetical protein [Gammaproteobacteria bacterium]
MATDRWAREKAALKKVQLHFDFRQKILRLIRYDAADANLNTSDMVRKIVGLPYKKIQRTRLGLSFNADDFGYLAKRYGLELKDEKEIRRRVIEEINQHYQQQEDELDG